MTFYIVHRDDVGKPPKTTRVCATWVQEDKYDLPTAQELADWITSHAVHFPADMVDENGARVFADERFPL